MSCSCIDKQLSKSDVQSRIKELCRIYDIIPPTRCVETSCADWCCTKLDSAKDSGGNFMSLPLIYTVEYFAIIDYLRRHFSSDEIFSMMHPAIKSEKCVFRRSGENGGCMIYPVRPYSCRVYGRTVPDYFWGIEYPADSAASIDCVNCHPVDKQKEQQFVEKHYKSVWSKLQRWSQDLPVVQPSSQKIFQAVTGMDTVLILGWLERNVLFARNADWFDKSFKQWWQTYSELL